MSRGIAHSTKHPSASSASCQVRVNNSAPCPKRPVVEVAIATLSVEGMVQRTVRCCQPHFERLVAKADQQIIATRPWPNPNEIE